jgi:NADH dehydrogenase
MHVVVLGGGYAGVTLVRNLERSLPEAVELTLVDERETHLVQHLIHRAIRTPDLDDRLAIPFDRLLARADHYQARVHGIDADSRTVETSDGTLAYDVCAVTLGARTAFYGLDSVETYATPLKRLDHVARIREGFERVREQGGRVVVGGAGLSGVQAAGELAELAAEAETDPEVLVLEQADTVAPGFPDAFRDALASTLADRGVEVRTGRTVEGATADEVLLAETSVAYDQFLWTGGITGPDALGDRRQVPATLRFDDRTLALGDAARVIDAEGTAVPATAQTAVGEAETAATNVTRLVEHLRDGSGFEPRLDRYRYSSKGWAVSVGDGTVAQVGPKVLRGAPAHLLKTTIGSGYMGSVGAISEAVQYALEV